jgi:hypothetical protein
MRLAIMQPYFLPYIGYFQLIAAVDKFVIYDRIKYTKKGWINRNRFLVNGADTMFSLPLKKGSDSLDVVERELASDFDRNRLLGQIAGAYRRAPHFTSTFALLERIIRYEDDNLFRYLHHSVATLCAHLGMGTEIVVSSALPFDHALKGQDKVFAICAAAGADHYINSIGGTELYAQTDFAARSIKLQFLRPRPFTYRQFDAPFVPWLSIIDVMMFNSLDEIAPRLANGFDLLDGSALQPAPQDDSDD